MSLLDELLSSNLSFMTMASSRWRLLAAPSLANDDTKKNFCFGQMLAAMESILKHAINDALDS